MNKIEEKIRIEKHRPNMYVLFPTNCIYYKKVNFSVGDYIDLSDVLPHAGNVKIIELFSNLSDTIFKVVVKNQSGHIFSHIIK